MANGFYEGKYYEGVDELGSNGQIYYQIPGVGVVADRQFAIADQPRFTPDNPPDAPPPHPDPNGEGEPIELAPKPVKSRRKPDPTLNE